MKKIIFALMCLALLVPVLIFAAGGTNRISLSGSYQVCTSGVTYYLPSRPTDADYAIICLEGNDIRWGIKKGPTANIGNLLTDGDCFIVDTLQEVQNFRFIQDASSTTGGSTVYVEYERWR